MHTKKHLTWREKQILCLMMKGMRCKQIADALGVKELTVRKQRAGLMFKFSVHNGMQLLQLAARLNLLKGIKPMVQKIFIC